MKTVVISAGVSLLLLFAVTSIDWQAILKARDKQQSPTPPVMRIDVPQPEPVHAPAPEAPLWQRHPPPGAPKPTSFVERYPPPQPQPEPSRAPELEEAPPEPEEAPPEPETPPEPEGVEPETPPEPEEMPPEPETPADAVPSNRWTLDRFESIYSQCDEGTTKDDTVGERRRPRMTCHRSEQSPGFLFEAVGRHADIEEVSLGVAISQDPVAALKAMALGFEMVELAAGSKPGDISDEWLGKLATEPFDITHNGIKLSTNPIRGAGMLFFRAERVGR